LVTDALRGVGAQTQDRDVRRRTDWCLLRKSDLYIIIA
jgi:hypothetical protein